MADKTKTKDDVLVQESSIDEEELVDVEELESVLTQNDDDEIGSSSTEEKLQIAESKALVARRLGRVSKNDPQALRSARPDQNLTAGRDIVWNWAPVGDRNFLSFLYGVIRPQVKYLLLNIIVMLMMKYMRFLKLLTGQLI